MQSINFGQTIARASSLIGTTLGSVGLFTVLFQVALAILNFGLRSQLSAELESGNAAPITVFGSVWYWAIILAAFLLGPLVFAGGTAGMLKADRGEQVSLGDCVSSGFAKMLPMLGLLILWSLGIYIGFLLLLVPGCILIAMWSTCVPVLMAEDTGVFGAFGRSRALTKGSRLKIFLLLFFIVVAIYLVLSILMAGLLLQGGMMGLATMNSPVMTIAMSAFGVLFSLVINAVLVAIYGELIDMKGERAADVFN